MYLSMSLTIGNDRLIDNGVVIVEGGWLRVQAPVRGESGIRYSPVAESAESR